MSRNVATVPKKTLKSRFAISSIYAIALTNLTEKGLVFFRKVFKTLTEAVSELGIERAAAIKIIGGTDKVKAEPEQQQWSGTPLPSNQPKMESFWHSPAPTPSTPMTTTKPQTSQKENKSYHRLGPGRQREISTYTTPKVQRSMEGFIQRTRPS